MESSNVKKEIVIEKQELIDLVFSWSIKDVINSDLYKDQVKTIPCIFSSATEYLNSFITPLLEETHAELLASLTALADASSAEIKSVKQSKGYKLPKDLLCKIELPRGIKNENDTEAYEPEVGDLIAITSVKPTCVDDLDRPERSYLVAHVKRVRERNDHFKLLILLSKPTLVEEHMEVNGTSKTLFAVKLINMTTNLRIWSALDRNQEVANMNIIRNILQPEFFDVEDCTLCQFNRNCSAVNSDMRARIHSWDLNESQQDAISSCIRARECHHQNTVKLIWGPPGTGKTKTVGFLLYLLLQMKCRTLACAPTNNAVLQMTKRVVENVKSGEYDTYGLGDIVLSGNPKRMKIDHHDDLNNVFLDHRVHILAECFDPNSGWNDTRLAMISLLKEPEKLYSLYLKRMKGSLQNNDNNNNVENIFVHLENEGIKTNAEKSYDRDKIFEDKIRKNDIRQVILQILKENKNKIRPKDMLRVQKERKSKQEEEKDGNDIPGKEKGKREEKVLYNPMTFGEFVKKRFDCVVEWLYCLIVNLYTHLPSAIISSEVVKNMFAAVESLKSFQLTLHRIANEDLKEAYSRGSSFTNFNIARVNSLFILESRPSKFSVPCSYDRRGIKEFCLKEACLIFCTTSSSAKLEIIDMKPLELVVIDEAAQLKECESTIPLQLLGPRHAILVGDERQLPAMVKSQISEEADFGRSLFERLAYLGHKKHLLNIQYRMHPSISQYPNREFYDNQILNGPNVKGRSYNRCFLKGKLYSSYSFINVSHGKEEFDDKRSRKNMVEVAVVSEMVESLQKEVITTRRKVRVGVISPYKAQIRAITEKIGKYTTDSKSDFFVTISTVDGFQGGEEDVIIISTVRCNGIGSISFLKSHERVNVALTRARYCLWIVGSGETLHKSGTFWKNLVDDAKERGCFHDAEEDKKLGRAIRVALIGLNQVSVLLGQHSHLYREARWKVCFTDDFWRSVIKVKNNWFYKKVLNLLEKLSSGWRQQPHIRSNHVVHDENSSQLIECYMVNMELYLVWTVDILKEDSHYIQVLQVWDILPQSDISKLSKQIDFFYGRYSADKLSRCKYKRYDGDFLVPMTWPVNSSCVETNTEKLLPKSVPLFSLKDESETSSTNDRNLVAPMDTSSTEADPGQLASESAASLSLKHELKTSSTTTMNFVVPIGCSVDLSCTEDDPRDELEISKATNRNFIVPKRWPADRSGSEADPIELLSKLMALLSLRDEPETSNKK